MAILTLLDARREPSVLLSRRSAEEGSIATNFDAGADLWHAHVLRVHEDDLRGGARIARVACSRLDRCHSFLDEALPRRAPRGRTSQIRSQSDAPRRASRKRRGIYTRRQSACLAMLGSQEWLKKRATCVRARPGFLLFGGRGASPDVLRSTYDEF